ncbi:iron chelate uptake ABC transporter family permease subunit, partial [Pantoea ananatis]
MNATPYRFFCILCFCVLLLAVLMLISVAKGTVALSLTQVLGALELIAMPQSEMISRIVIDLRLPRTLLAALTGAGLAMVGALLQTTTRNDLADPFL